MGDTAAALRRQLTPPRLEVAGAALVALAVSHNLWRPGTYLSGFDTVAYSGPNLEVTIDAWRAGRLPLWNDTIFGGIVHLGNPQAGGLYPPKVIALFTDTNRAMGLLVTAHLLLLAIGMVYLVRRLGCRPPAAFAAAMVMTANGVVLSRSLQFEQIIVLSWIPVLLLGITVIMSADGPDRPWRAMAGTAIVTTLALLAGHPQITYQVVFVAAVWTAVMLIRHPSVRQLTNLAVSAGLGALIAMPHLAAAVAGTSDASISLGRTSEQLLAPGQAAQYQNLLNIVWGTVRPVQEALFTGSFEAVGHVGVAVTILAAVGVGVLWARDDRAMAVALVGMAGLGVIWSLGPRTIVFDVAFEVLPGFDLARVSARWLDIMAPAAAIAVGFAVDAFVRRDVRPSLVLPGLILGAVAVLLAFTSLRLPDTTTVVFWVVIAVVLLALIATWDRWRHPQLLTGAVLIVVAFELAGLAQESALDRGTSNVAFDDLSAAPSDALEGQDGLVVAFTDDEFGNHAYLVPGFRPNTNTLAGVRSLDGYDGGVQVTERWVELIERIADNPDPVFPIRNNLPVPFEPDLAADLAVRWMVLDNDRDPEAFIPGWEETPYRSQEFSVWENPEWLGPAQARSNGDARALAVERPDPETVEVQVGGRSDESELIVLDQQFAPGWTADADGESVDTVAADDFFLAAEAPPGTGSVTFRYEPWWLTPSLIISVLGIALVVGLFVLGHRTRAGEDDPDGEGHGDERGPEDERAGAAGADEPAGSTP